MRAWSVRCAFLIALPGLCTGWLQAAIVETGFIQVSDANTDASLGYVANMLNGFGEYGDFTPNSTNRLLVSFTLNSTFSLNAVNGSSGAHPYVGGIVGFYSSDNNLYAGSANYELLGGTDLTAVNSPPADGGSTYSDSANLAADIESSIWSLSTSNALLAQWVNSDSSKPATYIEYSSLTPAFVLVGDRNIFESNYVSEGVDFTFVPTSITGTPEPSVLLFVSLGVALLGVVRGQRRSH